MLLTRGRLGAAIAGLSIDQLVAWGVLYYAYSVLSAPIAVDLGVSRLHVAAAFSTCLLVAGRVGRRLGPLLDARGTRGALRLGAVAAPPAFAALALVAGPATLVVVFALLGAVHAVTLYEPAFRTVVDWCPGERSRGRALLALTSVGGLASTVFLPLTGWLVDHWGWRTAVVALSALLAVVLVPARFLLPLPDRGGARPPPARRAPPGSANRLAAGLALHALASTGVFVTLVWHLVERGDTLAGAAALAGAAGAAQIPGRIVSGPLRRLVGPASFLPALLGVQAAALGAAVLADGPLSTAGILVFGAASGTMTLERATVVVEWYGRAGFGAHQGRLAAATGTARAISPFVVEAGHGVASYAAVFAGLSVVLALAAWACRSAARLRARELRGTMAAS